MHGRLQLPEHEPFGGRLHQPVERDGRCRWRQHESDSRHTALAGEQHGGRAEPPGRFMCESRCGSRADEQRTRRCPPIAERNDQALEWLPGQLTRRTRAEVLAAGGGVDAVERLTAIAFENRNDEQTRFELAGLVRR